MCEKISLSLRVDLFRISFYFIHPEGNPKERVNNNLSCVKSENFSIYSRAMSFAGFPLYAWNVLIVGLEFFTTLTVDQI